MVTSIVNLSLPVDDPNRVIHIYGYQAESYSESMSNPNYDSQDIMGRSSPVVTYSGGSARSISFSMLFHRDMVSPSNKAKNLYAYQPGGLETKDSDLYFGILGSKDRDELVNLKKEYWSERYMNFMERLYTGSINLKDSGLSFDMSKYMTINSDKMSEEEAELDATIRFNKFINKLKALNYPVYTPEGIVPPKVYLKIGGDSGFGGLKLKGYCSVNVNYDGIVKYNSLISTTVDFNFTEVVDIAWSAPEVIDGMQRYSQYMDSLASSNNKQWEAFQRFVEIQENLGLR